MTDFFKLAKENKPLPRTAQTALALNAQTGDANARQALVLTNIRMAINVARKHQRRGIELEDLIATAAGATLDAIRVFDASKGANFPTVARQWMVARCQEVVKARGAVSGDDRTTRALYRKVQKAARTLAEEGMPITPENAAAVMGLPAHKVIEAWPVVFGDATSLSTPCGDENGATVGDLMPGSAIRQDVLIDRVRQSEAIALAITEFSGTLSLRDRHIFESRNLAEYLGNEPVGQFELGEANGISKQRVGQIERALSAKCAKFMANRGIAP